jgi:N-ethylmaleimide reductase
MNTHRIVVFTDAAGGMGTRCLFEPNEKGRARVQIEHVVESFRKMFSGPVTMNTGFDEAKANAVLASDDADLVAFGVLYIASPDLAARLRAGGLLNKPGSSMFYGE